MHVGRLLRQQSKRDVETLISFANSVALTYRLSSLFARSLWWLRRTRFAQTWSARRSKPGIFRKCKCLAFVSLLTECVEQSFDKESLAFPVFAHLGAESKLIRFRSKHVFLVSTPQHTPPLISSVVQHISMFATIVATIRVAHKAHFQLSCVLICRSDNAWVEYSNSGRNPDKRSWQTRALFPLLLRGFLYVPDEIFKEFSMTYDTHSIHSFPFMMHKPIYNLKNFSIPSVNHQSNTLPPYTIPTPQSNSNPLKHLQNPLSKTSKPQIPNPTNPSTPSNLSNISLNSLPTFPKPSPSYEHPHEQNPPPKPKKKENLQ